MGLLPRSEDDSELDSAESDADPLEHAGVFTTEEASRIYLEKLNKLKVCLKGFNQTIKMNFKKLLWDFKVLVGAQILLQLELATVLV